VRCAGHLTLSRGLIGGKYLRVLFAILIHEGEISYVVLA